jgi:hypothetical protein
MTVIAICNSAWKVLDVVEDDRDADDPRLEAEMGTAANNGRWCVITDLVDVQEVRVGDFLDYDADEGWYVMPRRAGQ